MCEISLSSLAETLEHYKSVTTFVFPVVCHTATCVTLKKPHQKSPSHLDTVCLICGPSLQPEQFWSSQELAWVLISQRLHHMKPSPSDERAPYSRPL